MDFLTIVQPIHTLLKISPKNLNIFMIKNVIELNFWLIGKIRHNLLVPKMMESAGKAFMPIYSDHLNLEQGRGTSILVPLHMEVSTLISLITVEGGIFGKKLVHKCNKRGVEGGKNLRNR